MNVGIIGSGVVGKTLAGGFKKYGFEVMAGSRSPEKLEEWKSEIDGLQTGNFAEAASFGDIVVLATMGPVAADALELAGSSNLNGKTVIDATNPISGAPSESGVLPYFTTLDKSLMEGLQEKFSGAHFVKAFSSVGSAVMIDPDFGGVKPTMFICGNNQDAKKTVTAILDAFGWETEDMGSAEAARAIEPLAMLWCIPGFRENRWTHAFKLLNKHSD